MRKLQPTLIFVALIVAVSATFGEDATAPFPFEPIGARHASMAGATIAHAYSAESVYLNPASLVWQKLSIGAGFQPHRFDNVFRSWWVHYYNRSTEAGVPLGLIMQGWDVPGKRRNAMIGMPIAYGFSQRTPAAVDLKWAWERTEQGNWIGGGFADIGFLARPSVGPTVGLVLRNLQYAGSNEFQTIVKRYEYGFSYGGGMFSINGATTLEEWNDFESIKDDWRMGFEMAPGGRVAMRFGYIDLDDGEKWYTFGIGLRAVANLAPSSTASMGSVQAANAPFEFSYSVMYNRLEKSYHHFLSYSYILP